jgi:hypothetical protein
MRKINNCNINWDEEFFEESGLCIWVFYNGSVEFTNEKFYKGALSRLYKRNSSVKKQNENFLIYNHETE